MIVVLNSRTLGQTLGVTATLNAHFSCSSNFPSSELTILLYNGRMNVFIFSSTRFFLVANIGGCDAWGNKEDCVEKLTEIFSDFSSHAYLLSLPFPTEVCQSISRDQDRYFLDTNNYITGVE